MRKVKGLVAGLVMAVTLPVAASAAAADHRGTLVEDAEGWTFGKAGAPLLAEHASFGCPHCGQFVAATGERVGALVAAGKLRFAWRPFLIFPQDRAAAVLTRCVAPARRLAFIEALMAQQTAIQTALDAADANEATRASLFAAELAGPITHATEIAQVAGLLDLAETHGLSPLQAGACLSSAANHAWVTNADLSARVNGVTGTPTFFWKGSRIPTGTPQELLALLPL
nr:thioredoxin domain-containing protein [uncultured Sphingomonas sp.]